MKLKPLHPKKNFLKFLSLAILVLGGSVGVILATQKQVFDEPSAASFPSSTPIGSTNTLNKCGDKGLCGYLDCPYGCPRQDIYGGFIPICQCGWGTKPTPVGCHKTDSYSCSGKCSDGSICTRNDVSDPCSCLYTNSTPKPTIKPTIKPSSTTTPKPTIKPNTTPRPTTTTAQCEYSCVASCTSSGGVRKSGACVSGQCCAIPNTPY